MTDFRLALLLFLGLVALAIPQAALVPLIDRDEPRFSEASREMIERGDYIVPYFNGAPRYQKPPGIYWCQIACFYLFGENEFAARFPSLLAGAGVGVILFLWARRMGHSKSTGVQAAILAVLSLQMLQQGRVATADGLLIFFMTLTLWLGWEWSLAMMHAERRRALWLWLGLVATFSLGFLTKGPEAWMPAVPMLIWAATTERAGGRMLFVLGAVIASLLPVLVWAIPGYIETKGEYWAQEGNNLGGAMLASKDQHGATTILQYLALLPFYFLLIWVSTLPWSPFAAIYLKRLLWQKPHHKQLALDLFLLQYVGIVFTVFTLMVSKLPHYTLPAIPALALVFARRWNSAMKSSGMAWFPAITCVILALNVAAISISAASLSPAKELARQAAEELKAKPDMPFATISYHEASVTWEMRRYLHGMQQEIGEPEAASYLGQPGPRLLILPTSVWKGLHLTRTDRVSDAYHYKTWQAEGLNTARFNWEHLTLVEKLD